MNQSLRIKGYGILFGILLFSLPFSGIITSLPNIILITLIALFPFCIKKEIIKELKNQTVYIYLILILFVSLSLLASGNLTSEISQLGKLYLPILLFILSIPVQKYFKELKISFITGVFIAVCISLLSIVFFISKQGTFDFTAGKEINEVLILERVYIAFLCVLSFVFSLRLYKQYKKLVLINISIIILFVLVIAARMALISIVLIAFLYMIKTLNKRKIVLILGLSSFVLIGFFMMNKNLQNRFFYSDQNSSFIKNLSVWEPRMVIWPCVYDIILKEDYTIYRGLSSYTLARKKLVDCYEDIEHPEKKKWFVFIKYNTHNQFLDFLLVSGWVAFLLFSLIFVISFWKNKNSFLSISLVLSFLLFAIVENYLHRQVGVYCFGIFLIFLKDDNHIILDKE